MQSPSPPSRWPRFGVWQAIGVPRLKDVTVVIPNLPEAFDGYTLVQLTDLHISRLFPASWTRAVVEATNRLGVDLIVVTGDVIDGSVASRRSGVEPLRGLRAPDGVYLIPGNHEYLSGYDSWMEHLASLGMHVLANAHAVIARGEANSWLPASPIRPRAASTGRSPISASPWQAVRRMPRSCCSIMSRDAPARRPNAAWRSNCRGTPMAG